MSGTQVQPAHSHFTEEQLAHMTPTERRMATEDLKKLLFTYSVPTVISMFINALYNVVDRFWVGKIPGAGKEALAGVGITMPIMTLGLGAAMLVGIGAAARISIDLGKRDQAGAEQVLGNAMTMALLLSVILSAVGLLFKLPLLRLVGASEATLPFASDYMTIILWGLIFQMFSFALNHPIRAAGNPKRFASTQLLGAITNMILDPIFILYFKMGVKGAAWATILAMCISSIWVLSYYFSKASLLRLRLKCLKLKKEAVMAIVAIGFSPFLMQVAASLVSFIINRTLKTYGDLELGNGDVAIGAMTVIQGVFAMALMPIFGISQGAQPIIGFNFGAKCYARLKDAFRWSIIYALGISVVGFVLIEWFAPMVVMAFNDSPDLVAVGTFGMRVMLSTVILIALQAVSVNFFTAIGRAKISAYLSLLRQVIVLIPAYIVFPLFFGLKGIWFAQPFSDVVATVVTMLYIAREFRLLKVSLGHPSEHGE